MVGFEAQILHWTHWVGKQCSIHFIYARLLSMWARLSLSLWLTCLYLPRALELLAFCSAIDFSLFCCCVKGARIPNARPQQERPRKNPRWGGTIWRANTTVTLLLTIEASHKILSALKFSVGFSPLNNQMFLIYMRKWPAQEWELGNSQQGEPVHY